MLKIYEDSFKKPTRGAAVFAKIEGKSRFPESALQSGCQTPKTDYQGSASF